MNVPGTVLRRCSLTPVFDRPKKSDSRLWTGEALEGDQSEFLTPRHKLVQYLVSLDSDEEKIAVASIWKSFRIAHVWISRYQHPAG